MRIEETKLNAADERRAAQQKIDARARWKITRFEQVMRDLEDYRERHPMPPPNRITREDAERHIVTAAYHVDRAAVALYEAVALCEIEGEHVKPIAWSRRLDRLDKARSDVALNAMRFLQRDPRMTGDLLPLSLREPAEV